MELINIFVNNKDIQLLCIFIVLDVIFGFLRSIKEKKTNSTIGIDGIIRKTGMIVTIVITILIDYIAGIDLIGFIPEKIKTYLGIEKCGVTLVFNSLYIIFESLSFLKNMRRCGLPFPYHLKKLLDKLLKEFTEEEINNENKNSL